MEECVIHEIVSFLCSEDLLEYASVFRRGSYLHKTICAGFQGLFLFPIMKRTTEQINKSRRKLYVSHKRLVPGGDSLLCFPRMLQLCVDLTMASGKTVNDAMRELRATLFFGHLGHLKRLTIVKVHLDRLNANAVAADLPAILRKGFLTQLEFIKLDVYSCGPGDDDEDDGGGRGGRKHPVFASEATATELLRAMAKHLPLLRDFDVNFGSTDLSAVFLEEKWPRLTVLRSALITRQEQVVAAPAAAPLHTTFAAAWAQGHFPSATTLVVGEWKHGQRRNDLVSDLPTDGMLQITKLVLTGRVLKNPLLNFRVSGRLTFQEELFGGGGVVHSPLFRGVQELDMSHLFVPVAFKKNRVNTLGLVADFYDTYADSFNANTCRAVQNISAAVGQASPPTLVISDAFFGHEVTRPANVMIARAIADCLQALRPAKLVVTKTELSAVYFGGPVFLDRAAHLPHTLPYGRLQRCSGFTGVVDYEDREQTYDSLSKATSENLCRLLTEGHALRESLVEIEIDSVFLHSHRTVLTNCLETGLFESYFDDCGFDDEEEEEDDEEEEEDEARRLGVALWALNGQSMETIVAVSRAPLAVCKRLWETKNYPGISLPNADFAAALHPYDKLKKIAIQNGRVAQGSAVHFPDLEMLCLLPPPSCDSLVVKGLYKQSNRAEFDLRIWRPFLVSSQSKKIFEYFPPQSGKKWRENKFTLTTTSPGGLSQFSAPIRSATL